MIQQPELDLHPPAREASSPRRAAVPRPRLPLALLCAGMAALVWAGWVTWQLVAPTRDRIVAARLSAIVGDYVRAQARSTAPRAQVEAEMRRFMGSLDSELQRRSAHGEVVLVGEAVLSRNVPDITDALRHAVVVAPAAPAASGGSLGPLEGARTLAEPRPSGAAAPTEPSAARGDARVAR